jgi:enamine deaminase RidA (YjgF/YER057c/UK114 family)
MSIENRLHELAIILPAPAPAVAAYVPWVRHGELIYVSGQLPLHEGKISTTGHLGSHVSLDAGQAAARLCALSLLAQVKAACDGRWPTTLRCVRLGGFIAATPEFTDHAKVMNGASELIQQVLGEAGRHARTTIGVASLPLGAAVEVEGLFALA